MEKEVAREKRRRAVMFTVDYVLALLSDGEWHSRRELLEKAERAVEEGIAVGDAGEAVEYVIGYVELSGLLERRDGLVRLRRERMNAYDLRKYDRLRKIIVK